MPDFARASLFAPTKNITLPQINSYEIIRDTSSVGFQNKLQWRYNDLNIIGFRVWRAVAKKVLLKKEYNISQTALEKLTGLKNFFVNNVTLFNKQFFSENSKVRFFESNSNRFLKDESPNIDQYQYKEVGFVKRNILKDYEFIDKKIKFGETYLYVISAITTSFFDSVKSRPVTVRVEDLEHPDSPKNVYLSVLNNSILVSISTEVIANDVEKFVIFKRDQFEDNFSQVATIKADELENISFFDFDVVPGRSYFYKVYSIDFFGNISLSSTSQKIVYDTGYPNKKDIPFPNFKMIANEDGSISIFGKKNHPDIIGYKVERRDSWRFEEDFNIKTVNNSIPWPSVNLFDASGSMELIDKSVKFGRTYQYRLTSINKNNIKSSFLVTPHIKPELNFKFEPKEIDFVENFADIKSFSFTVENVKQKPIFTKLTWNIEGEWDYFILEIKKGISVEGVQTSDPEIINVKIDNVHPENCVYWCGLESGFSYEGRLKVYNGKDELLTETKETRVTRITI